MASGRQRYWEDNRRDHICTGGICTCVEIYVNIEQTGGSWARYLKDNFLVYCKFGNNVCQKQVPTVFACWVHTGLGEQAGPRKGHEAAQLAVAVLVVVMDVVGRMLHQ